MAFAFIAPLPQHRHRVVRTYRTRPPGQCRPFEWLTTPVPLAPPSPKPAHRALAGADLCRIEVCRGSVPSGSPCSRRPAKSSPPIPCGRWPGPGTVFPRPAGIPAPAPLEPRRAGWLSYRAKATAGQPFWSIADDAAESTWAPRVGSSGTGHPTPPSGRPLPSAARSGCSPW